MPLTLYSDEPVAKGVGIGPARTNFLKELPVGFILLVVVLVLLLGGLPNWPYSRNWGYGPSGILGLLLVILLVMMLMQTGPFFGPAGPGTPPVIVRP